MPNIYVDLQTIKGSGGLNIGTTVYDARLLRLMEDVSRQLEGFCNRTFYYVVETRKFDGDGSQELVVPDLISVGTLSEDTNLDGTYETDWAATDYILYPLNANPTGSFNLAKPYRSLVVNPASNGTQDSFIRGLNNYQIVGTWGYAKVSRLSGLNGSLADATSTALILSAAPTGTIEVGHTVLIENEQVFVSSGTAATGTSLTVLRAQNGTTGTVHTSTACRIIEYPGPVIEAAFIQTARLWRRKDSAFSAFVIAADQSSQAFRMGIDPDLRGLLSQYRIVSI